VNSEQTALLRCIAENWRERTPRSIYADWLEEHQQSDRDAATIEYIRGGSFEWLRENYARLIPKFMRYYCRMNLFPKDYEMYKAEPTVKALVRVSRRRGYQDSHVWLNFSGGFLVRTWTPSFDVTDAIRGYLLDDQPLVVNCCGGGDDSRMAHDNRPVNPAIRMFNGMVAEGMANEVASRPGTRPLRDTGVLINSILRESK